jgi:hypothetical protein
VKRAVEKSSEENRARAEVNHSENPNTSQPALFAPTPVPDPPRAPKPTAAERRAAKAAGKAALTGTEEGRLLALWRELSGNTTAHDARALAEISTAIRRDGALEVEQAIRGSAAHPWWGEAKPDGRPCANITAIMRPKHLPGLAESWRAAEERRLNPPPAPVENPPERTETAPYHALYKPPPKLVETPEQRTVRLAAARDAVAYLGGSVTDVTPAQPKPPAGNLGGHMNALLAGLKTVDA